jgi:hypothetical protein
MAARGAIDGFFADPIFGWPTNAISTVRIGR